MNKILKVEVGDKSYPTNCYIVYDSNNKAIVIDPGYEFGKIKENIDMLNLNVEAVILTHVHADHLGALKELENYTKADVYIHKNGVNSYNLEEKTYYSILNVDYFELDNIKSLEDNDVIKIGDIVLDVIYTPGHTDCCICLYNKDNNILFTGDTLFYNCHGRCDLYTSDINDMKKSLNKLFNMFKDVIIYPGHEKSCNIKDAKKRVNLLMSIKGE